MENSFAIQFNPIATVKTVKEYETEIECLKAENFELKHKLSMNSGLESRKVIDENIKIIENLKKEKENNLIEFKKELNIRNDKISSYEEENQKLIAYLEDINGKYKILLNEISKYKNELVKREAEGKTLKTKIQEERDGFRDLVQKENKMVGEMKKEIENKDLEIQNLNNRIIEYEKIVEEINKIKESDTNYLKNEILQREELFNRYKDELKIKENRIEEILKTEKEQQRNIKELEINLEESERILHNKNLEIKELENIIYDKDKKIEELIKSKDTKDKIQIEDYLEENNKLKNNLRSLLEENEKNKMECNNFRRELSNYNNENNRLKIKNNKLIEKIKNTSYLKKVDEYLNLFKLYTEEIGIKIKSLEESKKFSKSNKKFLKDLKLKNYNRISEILDEIKNIFNKLTRKNHILENEIKEITFFAENNKNILHDKTKKILEEFTKEFNEARIELNECQKYLIKKGEENKNLKKEIRKLERKVKIVGGM